MALKQSARRKAAALYGTTALLGVAWFEYVGEFVSNSGFIVLIPYGSVIIAAAILGAVLVNWYFPETGVFELLSTPLIVIVCAALAAGQAFAYALQLFSGSPHDAISDIVGFGVYSSVVFLWVGAPIILPVAMAVSFLLWKQYKTVRHDGMD